MATEHHQQRVTIKASSQDMPISSLVYSDQHLLSMLDGWMRKDKSGWSQSDVADGTWQGSTINDKSLPKHLDETCHLHLEWHANTVEKQRCVPTGFASVLNDRNGA
jgi:hypothetical protein